MMINTSSDKEKRMKLLLNDALGPQSPPADYDSEGDEENISPRKKLM